MKPSTSVWAFLRAFGGRWFVAMSGPLTVPFTAAAVFVDNAWLKLLFGLSAATCATFTSYWLWRAERQRAIALTSRANELEERLEPRLVFVQQDCCRRNSSLGVVGVANPHPVSVDDAKVYISIPALQVDDVLVKRSGMAADEGLNIDHGRHHHTSYIVSVGDNLGQFFFHPAYGPHVSIEAGRYTAELCVKGRNIAATIARLDFVLANPRSMKFDLVAE
jgi:hypothetical protein